MKFSRKTRKQIKEVKRAATMLLVIVLALMIAAHGALAIVLICTLSAGLIAGHIIGSQTRKSPQKITRTRKSVNSKQPKTS